MYSGEAIVPQDHIQSFLKTAEILEIIGLLENSQDTRTSKNKISAPHHSGGSGSACFKNSELTVTTKKFDKAESQSPVNINSIGAKPCKSNPLVRAYEANNKRPSGQSNQENKKSIRNYEAGAPVFDNRNIYPVDVVQSHFDYSGEESFSHDGVYNCFLQMSMTESYRRILLQPQE